MTSAALVCSFPLGKGQRKRKQQAANNERNWKTRENTKQRKGGGADGLGRRHVGILANGSHWQGEGRMPNL